MVSRDAYSLKTRLVGGIATGLVYYVTTLFLLPLVSGPSAAAPLWLPSGIAAGGSIFFGLWVVPFVFLASLASALPTASLLTASMMATGAAIEVAAFYWLLRRFWRVGTIPSGLGPALGIGGATILAPVVPALVGVAAMAASGLGSHSATFTFLTWWLCEVAGIGTVIGIAILWHFPLHERNAAERIEAAAAVLVTILAAAVFYTVTLPVPAERAVPFLFLPLFTWIAFRGEARSMGLTVAAVSIISTLGTLAGRGPFAGPALDDSLLALNLVISVFAFSSLALAILVADHRRSLVALENVSSDLACRVEERTADLRVTNEVLKHEVNERAKSQEAAEENEVRFRLLYEQAPLAYQSLDANALVRDVNAAWLDLFGYDRADVLGRSILEFVVEADHRLLLEHIDYLMVSGHISAAEFRMQAADGRVFVASVDGRVSTVRGREGRRAHFIIQDVTERNREVEALRESREHFESLFENNHTSMVLVDPATAALLDANAAACEYYGYSHSEFVGMTMMDLNGLEAVAMYARLASSAASSGVIRQERHRLASGEWRDVEIHAGPIRMGERTVLFATFQDVTERVAGEHEIAEHRERLSFLVRERTAELELAYSELEASGQAKDQFMANMSHELRTPLNSIIGFSDMLLSGLAGKLTEEHGRQIGMINNSGRHLLSLVNDVLDLAKIQTGGVSLEVEEFDLPRLLDEVVEAVHPLAEHKGLRLQLQTEVPTSVIESDRRKVQQILLNLVGNAVKFTDAGEVVLHVACDERDTVIFTVSDTGVGIPESELGRVFLEFQQSAEQGAVKPEGTGLGLAISLRLARILGGDIKVTSQVDRGSTFSFSLPAAIRCVEAVRR